MVDEERFRLDQISLLIRGQRIRVPDACTVTEIWWHFGEIIDVYIEKPRGLEKGEHDIQITIALRRAFDYGVMLSDLKKPGFKVTVRKRMSV